jgi:carboxypeptidase C (cathepsin A)
MKKNMTFICLSLIMTGIATISLAQKNTSADSTGNALLKAEKYISKHSIKIDNKPVNYTATVGTLILKNEEDQPIASLGYTAYTKDGETNQAKRPVTFAYNGGPGNSSLWLHMGVLGPKRVVVNDPLPNGPAPYKLEDNNYSILDISDIVLIDPVGTGLSRPLGKAKNSDFWGVDQDIKSISQFIRNYITDNEKWNSPKFLLGESYGTFRSAGIADYLQEAYGMSVNGIVLVSNVLDMRILSFSPGDDISYIVYLPTYAATSWFNNRLADKPVSLNEFLKDVRAYSIGEYANALIKGDQLGTEERERELTKLAAYTGLSKTYWDRANLRVNQGQFCQELLLDSGMSVGRLDSRYTGINQNALSESTYYDPSYAEINRAFIPSFMNYFTTELKVSKDKTYNTVAYIYPDFKWDWKRQNSNASSPSTAPDLLNAMSNNPKLKVLVLNGIYDLATPFAGTEYTFNHMGLDKKVKGNIIYKYYEAGHMMYIQNESAAKFKKDVAEFISDCLK